MVLFRRLLSIVAAVSLCAGVMYSALSQEAALGNSGVERSGVELDRSVYDGYVGQYEFTPALIFIVTREGDSLFAKLGGQPRRELIPASEEVFFYPDAAARVTFERDEKGKAKALVLHEAGHSLRAARIE